MGDFRAASKSLRLKGEAIEKNAQLLTRRVAMGINSRVVRATPWKTGRAKTNWRTAIGEANTEVLFPQPQKPPSPEWAQQRALDEARDVVDGYAGQGDIHISNSLDYVPILNSPETPSHQAPAHFIEIAVATAVEDIRKAKLISGENCEVEENIA